MLPVFILWRTVEPRLLSIAFTEDNKYTIISATMHADMTTKGLGFAKVEVSLRFYQRGT